jgi:hypothetical protein
MTEVEQGKAKQCGDPRLLAELTKCSRKRKGAGCAGWLSVNGYMPSSVVFYSPLFPPLSVDTLLITHTVALYCPLYKFCPLLLATLT